MQQIPVSRSDVLGHVSEIDAAQYARRRNHTDGGTQISAFLTRGLVSLPEVRDEVLQRFTAEQAYTFVYELAWREYWQREWTIRGDAIFTDLKRPQHPVTSTRLPRAVLDADTGVNALDAAIRGLYDTGYVHNHERMWLAGLVCNIARTHWWEPSLWMYHHLLDGDPASNSLSWQWVAGTNSAKKYLPAQSNVNAYSPHRQQGSVIDHDYDALAELPVPERFSERTDFDVTWVPPAADTLALDPAKPTVLYHSFWLNAAWRADQDANRVVLLEPSWFARFPISPRVTDYVVRCAREIPGAQVVVADFDDLALGGEVYFASHPSVAHWRGTADEMPRLFPHVPERSYGSFTSYWKQCQKTLK
ncbi:FAD-binding domain-containing protein [Mycolicibacterium sp. P1-18]|uniref:FAD-binding domain-containing protein n=1 Tax=Mycolicibacterium sp. P1-18 TaxID=2024615 RepID=UPI0015635B1C|nr:FAD-binding domain-containing protein [Mycolicibacterium sp. P1-18]